MKIAIFSDSHDNLPNIEKFLNWVNNNNITQLIFCGDLCAPTTLKKLIAPGFSGDIHMVFGNVTDREVLPKVVAEFSHIHHYGDLGDFVIDKLRFAITHYPDEAKELGSKGIYDFIFYGHNHTPWEEKFGNTIVVNPGTLAGMFQKATFAVLDTKSKKLELKILELL